MRVSPKNPTALLGGEEASPSSGLIGAAERHYNGSKMAAGDAQRVWFPEMIDNLRSHWLEGMSFDTIIDLRDDLDAMLQRIRSERHTRPPVLRCPRCAATAPAVAETRSKICTPQMPWRNRVLTSEKCYILGSAGNAVVKP
jgi:hypothetical protein